MTIPPVQSITDEQLAELEALADAAVANPGGYEDSEEEFEFMSQIRPLSIASIITRLRAAEAERNAQRRQVDTLTEWYSNSLDVINEITAALPGVHYMDPPDGGDVSVPEQVHRMAKDAERYRLMRDGSDWPAVFASHDAPEPLRGADLDTAMERNP